MIEKLFNLFQGTASQRICIISTIASQVIATFEKEFAKDKNGRDAAIDALIDLLKLHKATVPVTQSPVSPEQTPVA